MRWMTGLVALAVVSACGGGEAPTSPDEAGAPAPPAPLIEAAPPAPVAPDDPIPPLAAGSFCYFHQDEAVTEALELTVTDAAMASGDHFGVVHDEANSYFAAFDTELTNGRFGGDGTATFDAVTEVDGDTQTSEEQWTLTPETATRTGLDAPVLTEAPCEGLVDRVFPPMVE